VVEPRRARELAHAPAVLLLRAHGRRAHAPDGGRGWSTSGETAFVNVLGPLYHASRSRRRDEERRAFLWPLFEHHRRGEERETRLAGLYSSRTTPTDSERTYAFGLGHAQRTPGGASRRLWPLYSWSSESADPGPFYRLTLYSRRERAESDTRSLFPLFTSQRTGTHSEWSALLGLAHHEADASASEVRTWVWPLYADSRGERPGLAERLTLYGRSRWEGGSHRQLGASLLHSARRERDERTERASSRTLLLFTHAEERFVGPHVPGPEPGARENRVRHETRGFLFDAFLSERATFRVWNEGALTPEEAGALHAANQPRGESGTPARDVAASVLTARGAPPASTAPADFDAALAGFVAANTHELERRHLRLPLLFEYERSASTLEWSGPLGLVRYARNPGRERLRLLYYGYRSETKDGRTSRDIFPFVTLDTGPSETRVTFLWRLFRYERQGERRGGHFFFIPWGDA
jgi:hypothetical protein